MSYIILSPAHSSTLIRVGVLQSRTKRQSAVTMPTCANLLKETKDAAARFFSSQHGDKAQGTWFSMTPEKIPGAHTCKDRGSSGLVSQRIFDIWFT